LCALAIAQLSKIDNLVKLKSPITVCGDIHGQFFDLLELFNHGGHWDKACYIFLGDYVDRGYHSVETFLFLLALKVRFPERVTLIRGNHESRIITQVYGFYDECVKKFGSVDVWHLCTDVFDYLPIAATIDNEVLCVHGGLSPDIETLDQINQLDRKKELPESGPICDLMWSDPDEAPSVAYEWRESDRGVGFCFNSNAVSKFC
jgi:diadenosine tetraphosphatase ApaH/serine/threonine PP2A family protein phosphatase